jgi:hypothetical protein
MRICEVAKVLQELQSLGGGGGGGGIQCLMQLYFSWYNLLQINVSDLRR